MSMPVPASPPRDSGAPRAAVHATEPAAFRPRCEPTSVVRARLVRCDELASDGATLAGQPELVLDADEVPMTVGDLDDFLEHLQQLRRSMLAMTAPENSPDPMHRVGGEHP